MEWEQSCRFTRGIRDEARVTGLGILHRSVQTWRMFHRPIGKIKKTIISGKSNSHCDWRSVSQSVLVWLDTTSCLTITVLSIWGALSDERTGLSFTRVTVSSNKSLVSMHSTLTSYILLKVCIYYIYTRPLSVQAQYSRSCPIFSRSRYNGTLVTWTAVCLTVANFKPLMFPYFPWYDTDPIQNDNSSNSSIVACVFVAIVMFLSSRCLATIVGNTYGHKVWWKGFMNWSLKWTQVPWHT
jgi:hypothetical protein